MKMETKILQRRLNISFWLLCLLYLTVATHAVAEGESINGFTYENYIEQYAWEFASLDSSYSSCNDLIFNQKQGNNGWVLEIYNTTSGTVTGGNYMINGAIGATNQEDLLNVDCVGRRFYTIANDGSQYVIRQYEMDSFLTGSSLSALTTTRKGLIDTINVPLSSFYGVQTLIDSNNDYIYTNDNTTIYKREKDDFTNDVGSISFLDSIIVDFEFDGQYLYIMTDKSLNKYNSNLQLISSTLNNNSFVSTFPPTSIEKYLFFNNFDNSIYIIYNQTILRNIDTITLEKNFDVNLISNLETNNRYNGIYIVNNFYYINDDVDDIFKKCNLYTSSCESLFDLTLFDNYIENNNLVNQHNPSAKINNLIIHNGFLSIVFTPDNTRIRFAQISGFDIEEEFDDSFTINSLSVSDSDIVVGFPITLTLNGTHASNNELLRYAFSCDNVNSNIFSESFDSLIELNSTYNYNNTCNYLIRDSSDGLNEKVVIFKNENNTVCENKTLQYTFDKSLGNKIALSIDTSLSIAQPYILNLYDSNNEKFIELNISIDTNKNVNIVNLKDNTSIYNYNMQRDLNLLGVSPYFKITGEIINLKLYIDFLNDSFIVTGELLDDTLIHYGLRTSISNTSINIKKYEIIPSFEQSLNSELLSIKLISTSLSSFSEINTKTCEYNTPGTYQIKGYLTSIFSPNNYNTFQTISISVRESIPADAGNVFDGALSGSEDQGFSVTFWKILMLLTFTLAVAYGAGFMNEEKRHNHPILLVGEFLVGETFMLFIMSYYINFFSILYFIIILFIDAAFITMLVLKALGGKN